MSALMAPSISTFDHTPSPLSLLRAQCALTLPLITTQYTYSSTRFRTVVNLT